MTDTRSGPGDDVVPGLDTVLARLSLGRLRSDAGLVTLPGRNENWAGWTDAGFHVFVKRFKGPARDSRKRMTRSVAATRLPADYTSPVLGWDEASLVMVSPYIEDAVSGADLAPPNAFGPDLAFSAGRVVGSVHALGMELPREGRPALPSAQLLRGLPLGLFRESSAGELKVWKLMQRDTVLAGAVSRLLAEAERAPRVPAHCDLRLDQLLIRADRLFVTDWEEFRLEDGARDVGSFAGECLHRAITGWAGREEQARSHEEEARSHEEEARSHEEEARSHEEILRCSAAAIDSVRPVVAAFWSGYRAARPGHDRRLAERSVAFAGWHMFDRMLAAARNAARVSAVHRAAAGVGRMMMTASAESAVAIGLDPE